MVNTMQRALIRKDLRYITSNKRLFMVLLIVPLMLVIFLPTVFILATYFTPEQANDFQPLIELLPGGERAESLNHTVILLILNSIMPVFFLIIPIMASSVMAASSFVGEKEKRTLETLLYCPLSLNQIFHAKILASFIMSMLVSFLSFLAMLVVVAVESFLVVGSVVWPGVSWLVILLLVAPAISLIAITMIVKGSAKAQTMEESQQRSAFLILPIMLLVVGQFTGLMLISAWILLGLGAVLAVVALLMMKGAIGKLDYETLLG